MCLQVVTQQEMLYNVDYRLQMMERQVARAAGVRTDEETKHLNAKIAKLTEVLDGANAEHAMLLAQVKKAEEDLSECWWLCMCMSASRRHKTSCQRMLDSLCRRFLAAAMITCHSDVLLMTCSANPFCTNAV